MSDSPCRRHPLQDPLPYLISRGADMSTSLDRCLVFNDTLAYRRHRPTLRSSSSSHRRLSSRSARSSSSHHHHHSSISGSSASSNSGSSSSSSSSSASQSKSQNKEPQSATSNPTASGSESATSTHSPQPEPEPDYLSWRWPLPPSNIGMLYFRANAAVTRCVYSWMTDMRFEADINPKMWDQVGVGVGVSVEPRVWCQVCGTSSVLNGTDSSRSAWCGSALLAPPPAQPTYPHPHPHPHSYPHPHPHPQPHFCPPPHSPTRPRRPPPQDMYGRVMSKCAALLGLRWQALDPRLFQSAVRACVRGRTCAARGRCKMRVHLTRASSNRGWAGSRRVCGVPWRAGGLRNGPMWGGGLRSGGGCLLAAYFTSPHSVLPAALPCNLRALPAPLRCPAAVLQGVRVRARGRGRGGAGPCGPGRRPPPLHGAGGRGGGGGGGGGGWPCWWWWWGWWGWWGW